MSGLLDIAVPQHPSAEPKRTEAFPAVEVLLKTTTMRVPGSMGWVTEENGDLVIVGTPLSNRLEQIARFPAGRWTEVRFGWNVVEV